MSFHTQFHDVQSITVTKVQSCGAAGRTFWHKEIRVTHRDHKGSLLTQYIELFSDAEDGVEMKEAEK